MILTLTLRGSWEAPFLEVWTSGDSSILAWSRFLLSTEADQRLQRRDELLLGSPGTPPGHRPGAGPGPGPLPQRHADQVGALPLAERGVLVQKLRWDSEKQPIMQSIHAKLMKRRLTKYNPWELGPEMRGQWTQTGSWLMWATRRGKNRASEGSWFVRITTFQLLCVAIIILLRFKSMGW